jgi:hypothetical protein
VDNGEENHALAADRHENLSADYTLKYLHCSIPLLIEILPNVPDETDVAAPIGPPADRRKLEEDLATCRMFACFPFLSNCEVSCIVADSAG